jgi:hypothetical protein
MSPYVRAKYIIARRLSLGYRPFTSARNRALALLGWRVEDAAAATL